MAFVGREPEIAEILSGHRDSLWVVGSRRVGKTELLREVERRAESNGFVPLYWSVRGTTDLEHLNDGLRQAWSDVEEGDLGGGDVFSALRSAARLLLRRDRRLLLLCDDAEGWIVPTRRDPSVPKRLRRALRSADNVRTVLASTVRLWELSDEESASSPLLASFTPPIYLGPVESEAAGRLVPPSIDRSTAKEICALSGGHPGWTVSIVESLEPDGDLERAVERLVSEERANSWFESDVASLRPFEYSVLQRLISQAGSDTEALARELGSEAEAARSALHRLDRLGFVRRTEERLYRVANEPFRRWLERQASARAESIASCLDDSVPARLLGQVYDDLHAQARRYMHRERAGHTLQPTALVHEAYLRLSDQNRVSWQGKTHFLAMGAAMMRRVLVDHARSRKRVKRGADWVRVTLSDWLPPPSDSGLDPAQLLTLDRALERLAEVNERQARIVELRFFGGLKVDEVAAALGVSKRTVEGDWSRARAWLGAELSGAHGD